ncbi:MAG TPA: amino acid permease [Candidatus Sulfotelmatobacter sp.]|nr:amino acid permease [Candidatus Sulfotelmatobacter sp.]
MPSGGAADQAAQDDAHLRSLGIVPELRRSLGFLSNFAVAFSYISVSTGTFTLIALGLSVGGPAFFWSWPLVVAGQLFVALNFAELASHFPVAGSIYQWSKRLSNRTLGWFSGWFYFWAGVITTTAVAITVPLVLFSITGVDGTQTAGPFTYNVWVALGTLVITTVINAGGVRLLSIINNIGVAAEIVGMLIFGLILLIFFNHQPLSVLTSTFGTESQAGGSYLPVFAIAAFMSLFVVYGFDTAGTFGEETVGASRHAPRGVLTAILLSGAIGAIFLLAIILATPDINAEMAAAGQYFAGTGGSNPIADAIVGSMGSTFGDVYLLVILAAVFVCTLAIQGATTRLMFSMGRDRRMPFGGVWATVNPTFKTPANAAIAVGVLAAIPFLVSSSAGVIAIAATGTIYLSYFLCNLGVLAARLGGWPRQRAAFNLGGWGLVVNIVALIWGGLMLINFGLWQWSPFGDWGNALRADSNPTIDGLSFFGISLSGLPQLPLFETFLAIVLVVGALYYGFALRGRMDRTQVVADTATGETAIA